MSCRSTTYSKNLFAAASRGSIEGVQYWLSQGDSINKTCPSSSKNRTALHFACSRSQIHIVLLLLELEADVNAIDSEGITCLMIAVQKPDLSLVSLLLSFGANAKITSNKGITAKDFTNPKYNRTKWECNAGVYKQIATLLRRNARSIKIARPSPKYGKNFIGSSKVEEQKDRGRSRSKTDPNLSCSSNSRSTLRNNKYARSRSRTDCRSISRSISPRRRPFARRSSRSRSPAHISPPASFPGRHLSGIRQDRVDDTTIDEKDYWTPEPSSLRSPIQNKLNLSISIEDVNNVSPSSSLDDINNENKTNLNNNHVAATEMVDNILNIGMKAAASYKQFQDQRDSNPDLVDWLEDLQLTQYLQCLLDMGVKTVKDLSLIEREDLEDRMLLIERKKFMKAASKLKTPIHHTTSTSTSTSRTSLPYKKSTSTSTSNSTTSTSTSTSNPTCTSATKTEEKHRSFSPPPKAPTSPHANKLQNPFLFSSSKDKVTNRGSKSSSFITPTYTSTSTITKNDIYSDGSYAVIIAINDYLSSNITETNHGMSNLNCARADGKLIKTVLSERHGFEILGELYDNRATSIQFLDLLDDVKNKLQGKTKARFVFFLASHGHLDEDSRGWICCHGTRLNKLNSTCIKMSVLKDFAESIDCQHQLYLLDCCHAGSLLVSTRGQPSDYELAMLNSPSIHGLTAVTKNQQALEENGHGMFTRSFAEGLNGNVGVFSRDERNYVTTTELFSYIQRRVLELAKKKGRDQTPRLEPLMFQHKSRPCNGQMLFFNSNSTDRKNQQNKKMGSSMKVSKNENKTSTYTRYNMTPQKQKRNSQKGHRRSISLNNIGVSAATDERKVGDGEKNSTSNSVLKTLCFDPEKII